MVQLKIDKLQVINFRNLRNDIFDFSSRISCIFGKNGNGKTNILEAIYFLLHRKSFKKNTTFPQLISIDCEQPEILFNAVFFNEEQLPTTLSGKVYAKQQQWYLNNKESKKKPSLKAVFINPFDSYAFHTTSSFRRTWMNQKFSELSLEYKNYLKNYEKALKQRNALLNLESRDKILQIDILDKQLAHYSKKLLELRLYHIQELNNFLGDAFKAVFDVLHYLSLSLESKFQHLSEQEIYDYYCQKREKDLIIGHTNYGVHRDDYIFEFDGFNSYEYCSLGQQKMSYLALIFAYIELFRYKESFYPLVLIDDVSGELDSTRWGNLIEYLEQREFQVIITTANSEFEKRLNQSLHQKSICVRSGSLCSINSL